MHTTFKDTVHDNLIFVHLLKSSWQLGRILAYNGGGVLVLVLLWWLRNIVREVMNPPI